MEKNNEYKRDPTQFMDPKVFEEMSKSISPELAEKWKQAGEAMYSNLDENGDWIPPNKDPGVIANIIESIKSGLHPSYLTKDEKLILQGNLGDNWYEDYGFKKEEMEKCGFSKLDLKTVN